MRIVCIGGGPAGLYFGLLMKKANPAHDVVVVERNQPEDTFGFGVVFSDQTLGNLREADPDTFAEIEAHFSHWDDIDVHYQGQLMRSTGHGFSGLSRQKLLSILQDRCSELGVSMQFQTEVNDIGDYSDADLIVACDGVNSGIRRQFSDKFHPNVVHAPNKFVWMGTTRRFPAFTFYFKENEHGLFRVHAYNYDQDNSTFIVECTEDTWRRAGLDKTTEAENVAYCEALFSEELEGCPLITNRSIWRSFPDVTVEQWSFDNVVLLGDSAHTAHFSVGSGTKLAMEDAIALCDAIQRQPELSQALKDYENERRPVVESTQRAARVSEEWFTHTERYFGVLEPMQFAFSLLTRSLRITHSNLELRDSDFVARVNRWFSGGESATPPMFTPFSLRDLRLENRIVVSPMCQYSAEDGTPNDWHLVHLGSRAVGGAGLVMTEMTNVSSDGRITPGCTGMYKDEHVAAWQRIVDFIHQSSQAKVGMQLAHAGRKGASRRLWEGDSEPLKEGAWPLISASAVPYFEHSQVPRAMTLDDMTRVRNDFVAATQRAQNAGFDLIELHLAHGYLLGCFLSPLTNHRTDDYGGSFEARIRFPMEVVDAVRRAWPEHKPLSVRISATDWKDGGFTVDDAVRFSKELKMAGCDIVDVSAGQTVADQSPMYGRLFQTPFSERVRLEAGIPTMTVGNISSYGDVNSILAAGRADLCAIARGHLYDPYWTRHAAYEQFVPMSYPDQYKTIERRYMPRFEWSPRGNAGLKQKS